MPLTSQTTPQTIAVIGSGVSGLSAAWLLSKRHNVTLYEADNRPGGHANTVEVQGVPVDTGFIVYNEPNYPNLTALFKHLDVPTADSDMSFGVSLDDGNFEYSSNNLNGLLAQRRNLFRPRFWAMVMDLMRFYKGGAGDAPELEERLTGLTEYLDKRGFCRAFQEDHLLPQAAAIWSASMRDIGTFPAATLLRFFDNHGLMKKISDRPIWRTVAGGSRVYVNKVLQDFDGELLLGRGVRTVHRGLDGVRIEDITGHVRHFDSVVIASHADQALRMLDDPTADERLLLGAFSYSHNRTVLHDDRNLMPKRKAAWASWNHIGTRGADRDGCVTYWMNRLQPLGETPELFITLNPTRPIRDDTIILDQDYAHPMFNGSAISAQRSLWSLQGQRNTWYCGAYFGSGFHEDGLQAGLAVAEALGGLRRPWILPNPSGRIHITEPVAAIREPERVA